MNQDESDLCDVVAEVCHEANRVWQRRMGQKPNRNWNRCEDDQREGTFLMVADVWKDQIENAEELHASWMSRMLQKGWKFGKRKDYRSRIHPCLLPRKDLEIEDRIKADMFFAIASTLLQKR